jgi:hypothetical protein
VRLLPRHLQSPHHTLLDCFVRPDGGFESRAAPPARKKAWSHAAGLTHLPLTTMSLVPGTTYAVAVGANIAHIVSVTLP